MKILDFKNLFFAMALMLVGCTDKYDKAILLLEKKDYETAHDLFNSIDRSNKNYVDAQLKVIEIEGKLDSIKFDEAVKYFVNREYEIARMDFYSFDPYSPYYEDAQKFIVKTNLAVSKKMNSSLTKSESSKLEAGKAKFIKLYNSLMAFKDKPDFAEYGFAVGYKYNKWLMEMDALRQDEKLVNQLYNLGYPVTDLSQIGFEYLSSQGRETEFTFHVKARYKIVLDSLN